MKYFFNSVIAILFFSSAAAQGFSINTTGTPANGSAMLDVQSTTKGLLLPRMTKAQKNAITTPATGLLVYQISPDSVGFHYYNGTQWLWLDPFVTNAWGINGNSGTAPATHFIGTTDDIPLHFRINNERSGRIESDISTANTFLGYRSGRLNTGNFNTAFGNRSLASNTSGDNNIAFGSFTLASNTTGTDNIAIGNSALASGSNGFGNIAIGSSALQNTTTTAGLVAIGYQSLRSNTTGTNNIGIGLQSLFNNTTGFLNYAVGYRSLYSNTTGAYNLALGMEALQGNTVGNFNIAIGGWQNLYNNSTGSANISIGAGPNVGLFNNTTGSNNISIGNNLYSNTTGAGNIALGTAALNANRTKDNLIAIGTGALSNNGINAPGALQGIANTGVGINALYSNNRGSFNTALGYQTAYADTLQNYNTAIGAYALNQSFGNNNTGIGYYSLYTNRGNANVAVGSLSLMDISGDNNVAIGVEVLRNNRGRSNTVVGYRGLFTNVSGNNNVAMGDSAGYNFDGSGTVAIGSKAMFSNTVGMFNTAIGFEAMHNNVNGIGNTIIGYGAFRSATVGQQNTIVGYEAMSEATIGSAQTSVLGNWALQNRNAAQTIAIGTYAGYKPTAPINTVSSGIFIGFSSGASARGDTSIHMGTFSGEGNSGSRNVFIGHESGRNSTGSNNSFLGNRSGLFASGNSNTFIGWQSGYGAVGSGNVFIGENTGYLSGLSNTLMIDNSAIPNPLIFGNFAADILRINGTLNINSAYSFPVNDGTPNQVLRTNGAGVVSWQTVTGESTTANNGLTLAGNNIALGGSLLNNSTITHGTSNLIFDLNNTGNFAITKSGLPSFVARSNGSIGVNIANPLYSFHVVNNNGADGPFGRGIIIENTSSPTTGEASIAFKNRGADGLPAYAAWMSGINNFTNYVVAYGDSLIGSNVKLKIDTFGNVSINTQGSPPESRLDVRGSFGNAINVVTVNTTLGDDDHTIIIGNAAPVITIVLPAANTCVRREYVIVNRSNSNQNISSYLDFAAASTTIAPNSAITVQSNGNNWFRIR